MDNTRGLKSISPSPEGGHDVVSVLLFILSMQQQQKEQLMAPAAGLTAVFSFAAAARDPCFSSSTTASHCLLLFRTLCIVSCASRRRGKRNEGNKKEGGDVRGSWRGNLCSNGAPPADASRLDYWNSSSSSSSSLSSTQLTNKPRERSERKSCAFETSGTFPAIVVVVTGQVVWVTHITRELCGRQREWRPILYQNAIRRKKKENTSHVLLLLILILILIALQMFDRRALLTGHNRWCPAAWGLMYAGSPTLLHRTGRPCWRVNVVGIGRPLLGRDPIRPRHHVFQLCRSGLSSGGLFFHCKWWALQCREREREPGRWKQQQQQQHGNMEMYKKLKTNRFVSLHVLCAPKGKGKKMTCRWARDTFPHLNATCCAVSCAANALDDDCRCWACLIIPRSLALLIFSVIFLFPSLSLSLSLSSVCPSVRFLLTRSSYTSSSSSSSFSLSFHPLSRAHRSDVLGLVLVSYV